MIETEQFTGSIETLGEALDKYEIPTFARDDPKRFMELVELLNPRDAEIMLCYAVLQKRPTDLSILFGKAGHRAEEDLHKAAHKLAGLIEFGPLPEADQIRELLDRHRLSDFGGYDLAICIWQYARCRDFAEMSKILRQRQTGGLRQHMLKVFKTLHALNGREEGLLAGWILWLVDGSNPSGKGWRKRKRCGREYRLGPKVFHTFKPSVDALNPRSTGKGGQGQRPATIKITRKMKFILRGKNA